MLISNKTKISPSVGNKNECIYELLNSGNSNLTSSSVAHLDLPGHTTLAKHFHPVSEEIYYILQGIVLISIDGEESTLQKGDIIHIPSGAIHNLTNNGTVTAEILIITIPAWSPENTVELE